VTSLTSKITLTTRGISIAQRWTSTRFRFSSLVIVTLTALTYSCMVAQHAGTYPRLPMIDCRP
jgi:hypothetical protein